jgi:hypothetical protein
MPMRKRAAQQTRRTRTKLPISTSGLVIFATAEQAALAFAQGAQVNNWLDQANGYKASQATAGRRPTMQRTAGPLGGPAVRFDGIDDYLDFNNPSYPQPCTYFVVARVTGGGSSKTLLASNDSNNQHAVFIDGANSEQLGIYDGAVVQRSASGYADAWHVFVHQAKPDPDLARADGVQVISGASGSGNSGLIRVGANSAPGNYAPHDLACLIMYRRLLSTSEVQQVERYLLDTYGVLGVRPMTRRFYFGAFSDSPISVAAPATFFNGINAIGLDAAMFTNGSTARADILATEADKRGVPIFIGSLEELTANPAADVSAIVRSLWKHKSLQAHYVIDEPATTDQANITTWVNAYRAADPNREAFPVLIGVDARKDIYVNSGLRMLVLDVYPYATGNAALNTTMGGFGYSFDMDEYLRQMTAKRNRRHHLQVILQTHGGGVGLRVPSAAEIHLEFWKAVSWGANGVWWFIWDTEDFWVGLDNVADPNGLRAAILALSQQLTLAMRQALRDTSRAIDEWTFTNGAVCRTLGICNSQGTDFGPDRFVVVYNPTGATISTGGTTVNGEARNLINLADQSVAAGLVSNVYSIPSGHGMLFKTTALTRATGVPDVPIDWTQTPAARWAAHPLNETANGTYTVQTHPVGAHITVGATRDDIQAAVDAAFGPTTILIDAGTYTIPTSNPLRIYGKSNLHFVAVGGQVVFVPGGSVPAAPTTDYTLQMIFLGPGLETLEGGASPYANYNAGVDTGSNSPIPWIDYYHNPSTDIYFKNITFNGGGRLICPLSFTSVRRVMFDGCVWTNLRDSSEASGGTDGFHWGSICGNTRMDQVLFRGCTFDGPGRWGLYLDGSHGALLVGCTFNGSAYGSGIWVALTNDDFSYSDTILAHVATTLDEMRSAQYGIMAECIINGSIDAILSYSGGNAGIYKNTINAVHIAFGFTARGSNKWGPLTGLVYYHFGNEVGAALLGNTILTLTAGPENGAQGLCYLGASHCGVDNTPTLTWQSPTGRPIWGRLGSGVDPLVPGVTKQLKIMNNVIDPVGTGGGSPVGLVLVNYDNVPGEPGPAGTVEGTHVLSGNTRHGNALT